jgi:hypothetical protein
MFSGPQPMVLLMGSSFRPSGEQIARLLRLAVLVALAVALVRAGLSFFDLVERRNLALERFFYIPAALGIAFLLTLRSIWGTAGGLFRSRDRGRDPDSDRNERPDGP